MSDRISSPVSPSAVNTLLGGPTPMSHPWLADRTAKFDSSGIRKVFDLAAKMAEPDQSLDRPARFRRAGGDQGSGHRGDPRRQERLQRDAGHSPSCASGCSARSTSDIRHADRRVLVTSGTSGALVLAVLAMVNPGDEVIVFDPYFVMYPALVGMVGGRCVMIDTYPDFRIDPKRVAAAITPRTKMILLNSPANPTGAVAGEAEVRALAELAAKHNIALVSDEIYREFCYDAPLASPAQWNDQTIVVDGFSKTYGVTGWRLGFVHGPAAIIDKLTMLQQYTFVCAPHPLQWAALAALDVDMSEHDDVVSAAARSGRAGPREAGYSVAKPGGAFYVFPEVPSTAAVPAQRVRRPGD